jgi:hypothetical protein
MPAVISVKGLRRLVNELTENVVEAVLKLSPAKEFGDFEAGGRLFLDGSFYQDADGELSFDGAVSATVPIEGVPADVDVGGSFERGWRHGGKGPMQYEYYLRFKTGPKISSDG